MFDMTDTTLDIVLGNLEREISSRLNKARDRFSVSYLEDSLKICSKLTKKIIPNILANEIIDVQAVYSRDWQKPTKINFFGEKVDAEILNRKTCAKWSPNAVEDAMNGHGVNIYDELIDTVSREIITDIDQDLLLSLRLSALKANSIDSIKYPTMILQNEPDCVGDKGASLPILINRQCNLISVRTNQSRDNSDWCIVNTYALKILEQQGGFCKKEDDRLSNVKLVGLLCNSIKVYYDEYASDATPILVGCKTETNSAAVFSPYYPAFCSGHIIDPMTFEPYYGFWKATGLYRTEKTWDYLAMVGFEHTSFSY